MVHANDNRVAAGTRVGDTLRVRLSAVRARWYPESDSGPSVVVIALAEDGKAPQIPGPMIRVSEGTISRVAPTTSARRRRPPTSSIHARALPAIA